MGAAVTEEKQQETAPTEVEHNEAPEAEYEPRRSHPAFGLGKVGAIIIAVLVVGLIAFHVGESLDPASYGRDAGGFAGNSDYGGGYDWGGSSYDYDWGGSSYDYSWDWDDDDDWEWGWTDSDTGDTYYGDYEEVGLIDIVIVLIIVAIVLLPGFFPFGALMRYEDKKKRSSRSSRSSQPAGASRTPASQLRPLNQLMERDPEFSAAAVDEMIANVYVQMQHAWTAGDFEPMRPYFNNTLFSQFSNQLDALKKRGHTNYVDNIAVLEVKTRGWYETFGFEYLVVKVRTRITDYTMDRNGRVVSGYTNAESYMEYEYTLGRTAFTQTTTQTAQTVAGECPNCGAPINLAQSAKCPYCGTVVESNRFTWVITNIKGISQQIQHH